MNRSDTGWERTHQRNDLLSAICADVAMAGPDGIRGTYGDRIDAVFGGFDDFLLAAFQRWFTAFSAGLDFDDDDQVAAANRLSGELCRRNPGLWAIVDEYRQDLPIAPAWARQRRTLMAIAGLDLDAATEPPGGRRCRPAAADVRRRAMLERVG
jgi:hypothetical protein